MKDNLGHFRTVAYFIFHHRSAKNWTVVWTILYLLSPGTIPCFVMSDDDWSAFNAAVFVYGIDAGILAYLCYFHLSLTWGRKLKSLGYSVALQAEVLKLAKLVRGATSEELFQQLVTGFEV